jgi:hypothetical protein
LIYKKDEVTPDVKGVLSLHEISFVKTDDCILEMVIIYFVNDIVLFIL